jgi:glycosyltransferase involved in cell wall biosynthesis
VTRVSVLMAAYNAERYVAQALRSALEQTHRELEVIVVDDGSRDRTAEIVRSFRDPRVTLLRQANAGPGAACNRAAARAGGEYLARLDADDLWEPTKLTEQVALLDARPEVGACFTFLRTIDADGRPGPQPMEDWFNRVYASRSDLLTELLAVRSRLVHPSAMIRRAVFEAVGGYDAHFISVDDLNLWLRIAERWELAVIPQPLIRYRVHPASMTASIGRSHRVLELALTVEQALERMSIERIFPHLEGPFAASAARDTAYARAHLTLAETLESSGLPELLPAALGQLHRAWALAPELVTRDRLERPGRLRIKLMAVNAVDDLSPDSVLAVANQVRERVKRDYRTLRARGRRVAPR